MAKKISQLTQATEVKSDDVTVIVQDGETKKLPLNMMVTKQDIENKKIAGLAKLDEIEATYENDTYTPTIAVKNKSSVKVGEGDGVDYSANVMDGHVKSAILTGQTLVNCINLKTKWFSSETNLKTDSSKDVELSKYQGAPLDISMLKSNQKYYVLPIVDYTMINGVNSDVFLQINTMISNSVNALFRIRFHTLAKPTIITTGELTDLSKSSFFIGGKSCELNIRDIKGQ